ncbi:MAG: TrbC/VirB2 family protein [Candidatus Moranbacteria bacterium]|nr:TrbC/VirB2 family protein [Candidatus Moranbacteria bacterium]
MRNGEKQSRKIENKGKFFKRAFLRFLPLLILFFFFISSAKALNAGYQYDNPLPFSTITGFLERILVSIQNIIGWLAVIMIVVGGVVYITSGGNSKQMTWAKGIIVYSLVGFAIAVAGPSLLREIKDIIVGYKGQSGNIIEEANSIKDILLNILEFLLTAFGILALLSFIVSAIFYLTSGGDRSRTEKAKKGVIYSIIAVVVAGGSLILVKQIIAFLEASA